MTTVDCGQRIKTSPNFQVPVTNGENRNFFLFGHPEIALNTLLDVAGQV
jgi:hypothetical protein